MFPNTIIQPCSSGHVASTFIPDSCQAVNQGLMILTLRTQFVGVGSHSLDTNQPTLVAITQSNTALAPPLDIIVQYAGTAHAHPV